MDLATFIANHPPTIHTDDMPKAWLRCAGHTVVGRSCRRVGHVNHGTRFYCHDHKSTAGAPVDAGYETFLMDKYAGMWI